MDQAGLVHFLAHYADYNELNDGLKDNGLDRGD